MKEKILSLICVIMLVSMSILCIIPASASETVENGSIAELNADAVDTAAVVEDVYAYVTDAGELQVRVTANENALKYRLYEKANDAQVYTKIYESGFPILYTESYDSDSTYAVSVISYFDGAESELVEIESFVTTPISKELTNVLNGKNVTYPSGTEYAPHSETYGYAKLTDGLFSSGRYSSNQNGKMDATIDLAGTYVLSELRLYINKGSLKEIGTNLTVQVYSNEEWITIVENISNADLNNHYAKTFGTGDGERALCFDLGGHKAEKIRITAATNKDGEGVQWITFYEAEASGILLESRNILKGKGVSSTEAAFGSAFGYEKLTDGIIGNSGRYSSKQNGKMDATIDLGGNYQMSELRLYAYTQNDGVKNYGTNVNIKVYSDGNCITLYEGITNEELQKSYTKVEGTNTVLTFPLNCKASKIQIISGNMGAGTYVTFYEAEVSGILVDECSYDSLDNSGFTGSVSSANMPASNILYGKPFVGDDDTDAYGQSYKYIELTDGILYEVDKNGEHTNRFSSKQNGKAHATVDLGEVYNLSELRFYYYKANKSFVGKALVIKLYLGEEITEVYNYSSNAEIVKHDDAGNGYLAFDLSGYKADKIEFSIPAPASSGGYISFYEIECSGSKESLDTPTLDSAISNAFDNNSETYVSVSDATGYSVIADFPVSKGILHTITIKELIEASNLVNGVVSTASDNTKIEIYQNGSWYTLYDNIALSESGVTALDFYDVECSKVRITFKNTRLFDNESEIRAAKICGLEFGMSRIPADVREMALSLEKLSCADMSSSLDVRYNQVFKNSVYKMFKQYALDLNADSVKLDAYVTEIDNYYKGISNISFTPQGSITLSGELVYNVYIPVSDDLVSFTLDGVSDSELEKTTVMLGDGKMYHRVSVELTSSSAARNIVLKATVTAGGKNYTGTWYMSITKYAEKVLGDANTADAEKTLVKDVLSYVRAAYAFFGTTDAEAMAKIDALLGENYDENSAPMMSGYAEKPTLGITAVTYNLTAKPALRFYLAEDFSASDFVFSIKGNTVAAEEGTDADGKKYVEVKLYAYELADTVDYTVNGESDSCHIKCYYEWAKTQNNDNLTKLVERFAKYCESAAAYRASVTN